MQVPSSQTIECYTPKKFLVSPHSPHKIVLESTNLGQKKVLTQTFGQPVCSACTRLVSTWAPHKRGTGALYMRAMHA